MKPLIKKVKGVWSVFSSHQDFRHYNVAAMHWCHEQNVKEGNYGVKTKTS